MAVHRAPVARPLVTPTPELAADESGIVAVLRAKITDQQH
jgi:hypothetical protein